MNGGHDRWHELVRVLPFDVVNELAPERLPVAVHPVPSDIDAEAAQMVLAALGTRTDSLTPAQRSYLASWRIGS